MTKKEMTKSVPISKQMVWASYQQVKAKQGGAGIDGQTIEDFEVDLSKNLYKLWNRLSSGSYFPPAVRTVFIPKKQGGERPLGIPTVSDRIAQGVVKAYLEPSLEVKFHHSSFGYRPLKSAHQAVAQCKQHCRQQAWVLDVDIKGFFDNLSHEHLLWMLAKHSTEKWVLMYVERWLKAGIQQKDGQVQARTKGTPQGGVVSPLLANLYLHHAFDEWMQQTHPTTHFERYADDIVIHCQTEQQAVGLWQELASRMAQYKLELHPDKTKIVYCKDYRRAANVGNCSFTFLGFSFQPRMARSQREGRFLIFNPVMSQSARQHIRSTIRTLVKPKWTHQTLEWFAQQLNSKVRGWVNYFGKFERLGLSEVFHYANGLLINWVRHKYRLVSKGATYQKWRLLQAQRPTLFYHWEFGIKV